MTTGPAAERNQLMTDIAKALDEAALADVAAYYAGQPKRNPIPVTLAERRHLSCNWWSWAIRAATSRLAAACHRPGSGGPIEDAGALPSKAANTLFAAQDVCLGRAAQ